MAIIKPVKSWLPDLPCSPLNERPGVRTKLAIIGASMLDAKERPPLDDPDWDVWGCNSLWRLHLDSEERFRADDWFEMHPISAQTPQEYLDMQDCPVNLYVLGEQLSDCLEHDWTIYPLEQVRARFGPRTYFTVTFAYELALAILTGYTTIGLWGVELWCGSTRERRVEFPCLNYWLGLARGLEIHIVLPAYSKLLYHQELYGYDYDADVRQSARDDQWLANNWAQEQRKKAEKEAKLMKVRG